MYCYNLWIVTLSYLHLFQSSRSCPFSLCQIARKPNASIWNVYAGFLVLHQRSLDRQPAPSAHPRKTNISDVKHRILESIMERHISISHFLIHALILIKHPAQISLASPTGQIRVVDWWRNAHAYCSLAVKVA